MTSIRLSEEDGKRFDRLDWLPFDGNRTSIGEAIFMEEQLGITDEKWQRMLDGELLLDDAGAPILRDKKPLRRHSARTWKLVVWLALTRSGVEVTFDELDSINLRAVESRSDEAAEPGKDPESEP